MSFQKFWATLVAFAVFFVLSAAPVAAQSSIGAPPSQGTVQPPMFGPVSPPQPIPPPGGEEGRPPSRAVACEMQLVQPGFDPPGWTNQVWYWADETRGALKAYTNPVVGNTRAMMVPPEGAEVQYTVYGANKSVGKSPTGVIVARPGDQFLMIAEIYYPSINGNIRILRQELTIGDVRLDRLSGDTTRLGLLPVGALKDLWVPQIMKEEYGFSVGSATFNGPAMAPDARAAVEVVEVLPPGAAGHRASLGCRIEELHSGDRFMIVGAVPGKDYSMKVHTYLPSPYPALGDVGARGSEFIIRR